MFFFVPGNISDMTHKSSIYQTHTAFGHRLLINSLKGSIAPEFCKYQYLKRKQYEWLRGSFVHQTQHCRYKIITCYSDLLNVDTLYIYHLMNATITGLLVFLTEHIAPLVQGKININNWIFSIKCLFFYVRSISNKKIFI